jgi:FtsZ-binding cell division protein ZapB
MRDFLLFLALLLSVFTLAAGGLRSDSPSDETIAALTMQVDELRFQNEQLHRLVTSLSNEIDACGTALGDHDADLGTLFTWSQEIVALLSPPVDEESATYDCDDATLDAFRFYTERGYPVCIMAGNLALDGESMREINHVWLLVRFEGGWLPVDWGGPAHDPQHFEGYPLEEFELREAVRADWAS